MTDAEGIRRFIAAAAKLEPGLARWTAAAVWRGLPRAHRREIRDDLIREAGRLLAPLSVWRKAHVISDLARRRGARPGVSTAGGLVALAMALHRAERWDRDLSAPQVYRVLAAGFSHLSDEMQEEAVPASNSKGDKP